MKLDAYYVSLLSEKYKDPRTPSLTTAFNSFTVARRSNRAAKENMQYSSLIYVIGK
jgi:hypothetical protein